MVEQSSDLARVPLKALLYSITAAAEYQRAYNRALSEYMETITFSPPFSEGQAITVEDFDHKIGDTIYVRKPPRFIGHSGRSYRPERLTEQSVPITLDA